MRVTTKQLLAYALILVCLAGLCGAAAGEEEINGLIIDQTRTLLGREFAREFCALWGEPRIDLSYNILIEEIPDARWGSLLSVKVNGRTAWRKALRPRSGGAREAARESIPQVRSYLLYLLQTNGGQDSADIKRNGY